MVRLNMALCGERTSARQTKSSLDQPRNPEGLVLRPVPPSSGEDRGLEFAARRATPINERIPAEAAPSRHDGGGRT